MDIEAALDAAERALDAGRGVKGTGFWKAVDEVRRDRSLADRYADRIAVIDRRAFEQGVKLRVPAAIGVVALTAVSIAGCIAVVLAVRTGVRPPGSGQLRLLTRRGLDLRSWPGFVPLSFLAGTVLLLLGTHSLTHWVVGRAFGMRFTHVFLGGPKPPRPGVKTDYATYLRASRRQRAVMHGSGAVVTKLVPIGLLIPAAMLYGFWPWLAGLMLLLAVFQILTDVFLSTKLSDWKKVKRELRPQD